MQMPKLHFLLNFISMERCISQWEVVWTRLSAITQFWWQLNIGSEVGGIGGEGRVGEYGNIFSDVFASAENEI